MGVSLGLARMRFGRKDLHAKEVLITGLPSKAPFVPQHSKVRYPFLPMDHWYIVALGFLTVVAVIDLVVGVSNDAVNFLSSAIGCRVARLRTTLWVATAGVLLGATFSSGMMEIARSGVFHPQMFSFAEIMVIFLAVMIADVILLDAFNSLGLPTSTTVSIVFELLGAAVAAALMKLVSDGASFTELAAYINSSKALAIISGILISVVVAFIAGTVVQFVARLLFTFHYEKALKRFGALYAGLAITAILYFLVMKGAKGASFMRPEWIVAINDNTPVILASMMAVCTLFFEALILFTRVNIFRIIILAGTFALAFAFAGNDLVNFVGVPLAAWDSFRDWAGSGVADESFMMVGLLGPSKAPTSLLLLSGLVMVLTLWFSRKARRVIETSISLSAAQSGGRERFGASMPARMIVRASMTLGDIVHQILPNAVHRHLENRFQAVELKPGVEPIPFDCVRASINLVVSAILIASATSLKLPLSTTYVTFMVAMGSSFADGAWDRETAVYRISGVMTVISGWFLTAICASSLAALVASLILWGGAAAAALLSLLALALLARSAMRTSREEKAQAQNDLTKLPAAEMRNVTNALMASSLSHTLAITREILEGLLSDREMPLRKAKNDANALLDDLTAERAASCRAATRFKTSSEAAFEARHLHLRTCTHLREISRSLKHLAQLGLDHVANRHEALASRPVDDLRELIDLLETLVVHSDLVAMTSDPTEDFMRTLRMAQARIDALQTRLLKRLPENPMPASAVELHLAFLLFARDLLGRFSLLQAISKNATMSPLERTGEDADDNNGQGPGRLYLDPLTRLDPRDEGGATVLSQRLQRVQRTRRSQPEPETLVQAAGSVY